MKDFYPCSIQFVLHHVYFPIYLYSRYVTVIRPFYETVRHYVIRPTNRGLVVCGCWSFCRRVGAKTPLNFQGVEPLTPVYWPSQNYRESQASVPYDFFTNSENGNYVFKFITCYVNCTKKVFFLRRFLISRV